MPPRIAFTSAISATNEISIATDVHGQVQALARAAAGGVDDVDVGRLDLELDRAHASPASPVSGTNILAIISVPGAVMITAVSRCLGSMPNAM